MASFSLGCDEDSDSDSSISSPPLEEGIVPPASVKESSEVSMLTRLEWRFGDLVPGLVAVADVDVASLPVWSLGVLLDGGGESVAGEGVTGEVKGVSLDWDCSKKDGFGVPLLLLNVRSILILPDGGLSLLGPGLEGVTWAVVVGVVVDTESLEAEMVSFSPECSFVCLLDLSLPSFDASPDFDSLLSFDISTEADVVTSLLSLEEDSFVMDFESDASVVVVAADESMVPAKAWRERERDMRPSREPLGRLAVLRDLSREASLTAMMRWSFSLRR